MFAPYDYNLTMEQPITAPVFQSEDTLKQFVDGITDTQRDALYAMLYAYGCRYDSNALSRWRKTC